MHWQRLSTQQTVGLFSRETDTAVYILHRCFLCPEGPRGGGQPNTNMVSFSHGGLTLFERVIWSHLLFISTMWLFVLGCLCHACFLLCGTSEDDNGSSLSGVSSFQELFFLSDQRFKLCIVYCDRRVSVSVCVCVCVTGGHDVQFGGLLDGPGLHPNHLAGLWRGLQSVSLPRALLAHHHSNTRAGNSSRISHISWTNSWVLARNFQESLAFTPREMFVPAPGLVDISPL